MKYDVIIIGAGPGGIFSAYELMKKRPDLTVAVFEEGHRLEERHCPIDGERVKSCVNCPTCAIIFFNDTATTEIYTLSLHGRSSDLRRWN